MSEKNEWQVQTDNLIGNFLSYLKPGEDNDEALKALLAAMFDLRSEHLFVKTVEFLQGSDGVCNLIVVLDIVDYTKILSIEQYLRLALDCDGLPCYQDIAVQVLNYQKNL